MRLIDYLSQNEISYANFGRLLGADKVSARRYAVHRVIPRPEMMKKIFVITQGNVTPNDFYELPPVDQAVGNSESTVSPLRIHAIREVKERTLVQGMAAAGNGHAMPSQNDLFRASNTLAEVRP